MSVAPGERLRALMQRLLEMQTPAGRLDQEIAEISRLLDSRATPDIRIGPDLAEGETTTPDGLAISPAMAAMCADDFARTAQFLRGVYAAIESVGRRIQDRPVRVLYAGCGPYATLAVPLMAVLPDDAAIFTLLDLHASSIESARSVVQSLELNRFVERYDVADATKLNIDKSNVPDIILVEMMQACLETEPQIAACRHLLTQAPDAELVPAEVRVELVLVDVAREFVDLRRDECDPDRQGRDRVPIGPVIVVNRSTLEEWSDLEGNALPAANLTLPEALDPRYEPMLFTTVKVWGGHVLADYDSGLTYPRRAPLVDPVRPGCSIQFRYELGSRPHLGATVLP